jgi:hypothetical protein
VIVSSIKAGTTNVHFDQEREDLGRRCSMMVKVSINQCFQS